MSERDSFRVLIMGSGEGTTADAYAGTIYEYPETFNHEIVGVVSNKPEAGILEKAVSWRQRFGFEVPTDVVNNSLYPEDPYAWGGLTRQASTEIDKIAKARRADLICAMGFMLIINPPLLERDILNWHPGILPYTAGKMRDEASATAIQAFNDDLIEYTVASVHMVTQEVDSSLAVIAEDDNRVDIFPDDTAPVLHERVHNKECARAAENIDDFRRKRDYYRGLLRVVQPDT